MIDLKEIILNLNKKKIALICLYLIYAFMTFLLFYNNLSIKNETSRLDKIAFICFFGLIFIVISVIILFICKKNKIKPELFFVVVASIFGLVFIFVSPLLKAHDEYFHWYKSYAVSLGRFIPETSEGEIIYDKLPSKVEELKDRKGGVQKINYKN